MDRKSITILIISFSLLLLWPQLTNRFFPPTPLPQTTNGVTSATNGLTQTNMAAAPVLKSPSTNQPAPRQPAAGPEQTVVLESDKARYIFTSQGGGLKLVELKDYEQVVDCHNRAENQTNQPASLNTLAPQPLLSIPGLEGEGNYTLTKTTNSVVAETVLNNGLRLIKTFQLSTNYLLSATVRLENRTAQPIQLPGQEWIIGTATPLSLQDESLTLGFKYYDGKEMHSADNGWFENRTLGCIPGTPRSEYSAVSSNVFWAAVHNQFFSIIAIPQEGVTQVTARKINLPPPSQAQLQLDPNALLQPYGFQAAFVYPPSVLPPNQVLERHYDIFAGPKEYNTLARLGNRFGNELDLIMDFGGFFGWFAKALLLSMNGLHATGLPYGIAIIVITIIIKLLFWPLTNASTKSMKRMAALQPQMKALQDKYKDDPKKMNMKLMEFMKENRVSPLGGCLPMLLQIPVFFGFYKMLQSAIELRGAQFLWACDLSKPDTVFVIPGFNFPVNILPLIMGVTMLWQARLTPPSPGMDPVQQRIMRYMPLMFMFFLYNFSAGLTLYWTVQNLLTIAQMKLTKNDSSTPGQGNVPGPIAKGPAPKKKK